MLSVAARSGDMASADVHLQPSSQVLVSTTGGDAYTAEQLPQLLDDLGLHQQAAVFGTVRKLTKLDRADIRVRAPVYPAHVPLVNLCTDPAIRLQAVPRLGEEHMSFAVKTPYSDLELVSFD